MTGLVKVLIGTAVVAAVGTGVALAVHDSKEKKYVDVAEQAVEKDEDGSVLKKIKRFVKRKVIKFLAWVALHMEQIEAASCVIGLASGVISIASAIKEYRRGDDIQEKLDWIQNRIIEDEAIVSHNHMIFGAAGDRICEKIGVDKEVLAIDLDDINRRYPIKPVA